jgi:hypothetical protein
MRIASALALASVALAAGGCKDRAAAFMGVDAAVVPTLSPAEEPNQVHFTITGPRSVTFSWHGSGHAIQVWSADMAPRLVEARTPAPRPFSSPGPWQEATLDDLRPGTEYGYQIGLPRLPVPAFFRTPPAPGSAGFTFVAVADLGASIDFPEVRVLHRMVALSDPAFVLGLGDLTYADIRAQPSTDRHFEDVMVWSSRAAYMPVWGEHEWASGGRDDLRNYKGRFLLPNSQTSPGAPDAGCCGKDWYWFDYGSVRFISYPEPYKDVTWVDWQAKATPLFAQAEADPAILFVVSMGHRPAYSSGQRPGDAKLRAILDGLGARFPKYVLNLAGHGGFYERSKPLSHVVHVTAGSGGGELEHADTACFWPSCKVPASTDFRAIHHAFVRVNVRPRQLRLEAICAAVAPGRDDLHCAEGDLMDQFTIAAAPALAAGSASAPAGQ